MFRGLKMARSAQAYVRGNTEHYYRWLEVVKPGTSRKVPPVWICGDCHFGNLGTIADGSDRVAVLIRDLDQRVMGNRGSRPHSTWRIRCVSESGIATAPMIEQMIDGYEGAFVEESGKAESPSSIF